MRQMMIVGAVCSGGTHTLRLGKTEIEPTAAPSVLHEQLRLEGWKDRSEKCLLQECGAITDVPIEKLRLLGPVEITPDGVEL